MAKMRILKPELDEIKERVGEDNPVKVQQESWALYKKAGVNPLGGCIPMLLPLPIVFAFLSFFPNLYELRGQSFLWMDDLSTYDSVFNFPMLPVIGNHLSLMCLLMAVSNLIYTYFNSQISGGGGQMNNQMKYLGYLMPIVIFFVMNSSSSGLNYYYFLANMLTFFQLFVIRYMTDDAKLHAQIQENKKRPVVRSGFQQGMDNYARNRGKG
jgi:YidC/Oxa1 family membrane protein insertase